jgi:hypothetical protein
VAAGRHGKTPTPGPTTKLPTPGPATKLPTRGRASEESSGTGTGQRTIAAAKVQATLTATRYSQGTPGRHKQRPAGPGMIPAPAARLAAAQHGANCQAQAIPFGAHAPGPGPITERDIHPGRSRDRIAESS